MFVDIVVFITYGTVSDAARTALWTCMVEDHHLFFQPFLECFKRDNMSKPKYNEFPEDLTNHQQLVGYQQYAMRHLMKSIV